MALKFEHVSSSSTREVVNSGLISELEYGLLKKYGEKLGWDGADKTILLDMAIDTLKAKFEHLEHEVIVRSLCHSAAVTADYLKFGERFNMKKTVLIIGEVGEVPSPWVELVQPAVYLHKHEFNAIIFDIPDFNTNSWAWMEYGPSIVHGALKYLTIDCVSVLACGVGGSVFCELLIQKPGVFGNSHFVYNMDVPTGAKRLPFQASSLEERLREKKMQLWLTYQDDPPRYDKLSEGGPCKAYEAMSKLQSRLESERKRSKKGQTYDEVLITDKLNRPNITNVQRLLIGKVVIVIFSKAVLESLGRFLGEDPHAYQGDLDNGLVPDARHRSKTKDGADGGVGVGGELPALRRLAIGPSTEERKAKAEANRNRLNRIQAVQLALAAPPAEPTPALTEDGESFWSKPYPTDQQRIGSKQRSMNAYRQQWLEIRDVENKMLNVVQSLEDEEEAMKQKKAEEEQAALNPFRISRGNSGASIGEKDPSRKSSRRFSNNLAARPDAQVMGEPDSP
mmetsp:Transcript_41646/g.88781  ORF Transcript_41646/g.88781 Transcript_41646/m.88781 type:complete len:508 (+) Transcript_41646:57-1580(+)